MAMESKKGVGSEKNVAEKGVSYFSLLGIIGIVLDKHGGALAVDEDTKTISWSLPRDKKKFCHKELEGMLEVIEPFVRLLPS
jgi:hypothetical protein